MATESERDDPFQQILHQIGGKSNIHLISAVSGPEGDHGVLQDFIADVFNNGEREENTANNTNGEIKTQTKVCGAEQTLQKTDKNQTVSRKTGGRQRAIKCSLIVFIFTQEFVCESGNKVCLKETLKDVRARVKRNALRPALLGLIHTRRDLPEPPGLPESVETLARSLRSVFIGQPPQAIWTGRYITQSPEVTQEIRWGACTAVKASLSAESGAGSERGLFWPLKCLPGVLRKKHRGQAEFSSIARQQGNENSTEEGIPLQTRPAAH